MYLYSLSLSLISTGILVPLENLTPQTDTAGILILNLSVHSTMPSLIIDIGNDFDVCPAGMVTVLVLL